MKDEFSSGFTIVELIITIAIIASLSGIVLVSITGYINSAKNARVKANVSQIVKEIQIYIAENGPTAIYSLPTYLDSNDYGFNKNDVTGEFVVWGKLIGGGFWAEDSTGTSRELAKPPDEGTYVVAEGTGCLTNEECQGQGLCYCSNYQCYGCESGQTCFDGTCEYLYSCGGNCNGCESKGSDDNWWECPGSTNCCSYYSGCSWNSEYGNCENSSCGGDNCGENCPDSSNCYSS